MNEEPRYDYVQFDHFQPWWQRKLARWLFASLVVAVVLGAILAKPAWRMFEGWQAEGLASEGEVLLAGESLSEAYDRAVAALKLRPRQERQLRLVAEVLSRAGASSGLDYWRRLVELPNPSVESRQGYIDLALALDRPQLVEGQLKTLLLVSNPPPRTLFLAARHHLLLGDASNALRHARALRLHPAGKDSLVFELSAILRLSSDSDVRAEAGEMLRQLARGTNAFRLAAMESLVLEPLRAKEDREWVIGLLAAVGKPVIREQVLLAEARMKLEPEKARDIALQALPKIEARTDEDYAVVVRWLNRHELFGRSAEYLSSARALTRPILLQQRAVAMIGIGQVSTVYREVLRPNPAIDPLDLELVRFQLALLTKDQDAADGHRTRILQLAKNDALRLRHVAEFAAGRKLGELAITAWKAVANDRFESRRALRALIALVDDTGDTWKARDVAQQLQRLEPEDVRLRLELAHYDLLLGENFANALSTADGLVAHPTIGTQAKYIVALANLKLGRNREARGILPETAVAGTDLVPPHMRCILVAVLGSTDGGARSRELAATIAPSELRPEERELIRPYL